MRSAVLFLPSLITVLMNLVTSVLLYTGPAASSRLGISRLRGISQILSAGSRQLAVGSILLPAARCPARYCFGLLAPYFERPCLRPCTPTASSVPRTTW